MGIGKDVKKAGGWMMFLGILYVIGGILCIALPLAAGVSVAWVIGIVLTTLGILQAIGAFQADSFGMGAGEFLIALLYIAGGVMTLMHPLAGLTALTMLITMVILMRGIVMIGGALQLKPAKGWGWVLFSGIVGVILAIMLIAQFPTTAVWLPGLLLGIDLLMSGLTILFTGGAVRGFGKDVLKDSESAS